MAKYVENIWLEIEECCRCGMPFAITQDFKERRIKDHEGFYCPRGHRQYYIGKTEEEKLREKLEIKNIEINRVYSENATLKLEKNQVKKSYNRMRQRIKNGVCPCCNRTFQNLLEHIKKQHPNFAKSDTLKMLREQLELSQTALAEEISISNTYISLYERKKPVPAYAKEEIENWMINNAS